MQAIRRGIDLILALLVVAVLAIGLAANLAPLAGARLLAIRTGSMEPTLPGGSLILVSTVDPARLVRGDVVTVSLPSGANLTHRVNAVRDDNDDRRFELQGDANPAPDPVLIDSDRVVGRVDLSLPLVGFLLAMLSMPSGLAALLLTGGTLLAAGWLLDPSSGVARDAVDEADRDRDGLGDLGFDTSSRR